MPPNIPQDYIDRLRDLERRLRAVEGRANIRPALNQVLAGNVTIGNGGTLRVENLVGGPHFVVGKILPNHVPGGEEQRGLLVYRDSGSQAVSLATSGPEDQGFVFRDVNGGTWLAEDVATGGMARPWMEVPMYPAQVGDFPQTTSAAFETQWRAVMDVTNPKLVVHVWHFTPVGSTGQFRLMVNGVQFGSTQSVSVGGVGVFVFSGLHGVTLNTQISVDVDALLSTGAGPVHIGMRLARLEQT